MPSALFSCKFGGVEGWGHAIRSGTLAAELNRRGWRSLLWTPSEFSQLPQETASAFAAAGESLRELDPRREAQLLVVDEMYTSEEALIERVSAWRVGRRGLLALGIDDMRRRPMAAFDLVVNPEIGLTEAAYSCSRMLLGERFALLRPGFTQACEENPPASPEPGRALVMLGGTDAFGYVERTLVALSEAEPRCSPIVVLGSTRSGDVEQLGRLLDRFPHSQILRGADSFQLAAAMSRCDFGVIACGSSIYELAAMRLPFIGLCLVDNQRASARKVSELWRMPILFRESAHSVPLRLQPALESLRQRFPKRDQPFSTIDGRGAERVSQAIEQALIETGSH